MAEEGVSGVFRLAIAPLAAAGVGGHQAPADADGVVQDIEAVKRYGGARARVCVRTHTEHGPFGRLTRAPRMPSAVEGTELLVRKDTVIWRGLGSSDRGPARVQW